MPAAMLLTTKMFRLSFIFMVIDLSRIILPWYKEEIESNRTPENSSAFIL